MVRAVAIPLIEGVTGGNKDAQSADIMISDLQIKNAEMMRGRAELTETVREKVRETLFDFDDGRREFQVARTIAKREMYRFKLVDIEYRTNPDFSTTQYINMVSEQDQNTAAIWRSWARVRAGLEKLKILCLPPEE